MTTPLSYNLLIFGMFPYISLFLFFLGTIMRYRKAPFTYSSLSSQFLENQQHFWDMVSFHYGILLLFVGHLIGFLVPQHVLMWNARPVRLYILEVSALSCGLLSLIGLVGSMERRLVNPKARIVTSHADWMIEFLLLFQIGLGVYTAIFHPWGSSWFATSAAPYLRSIFRFNPDVSYLATLPLVIKLHIFNAWLIFLLIPFTRLVHILVAPFPYVWRKPEVVRWYGQPDPGGYVVSSAVAGQGRAGQADGV